MAMRLGWSKSLSVQCGEEKISPQPGMDETPTVQPSAQKIDHQLRIRGSDSNADHKNMDLKNTVNLLQVIIELVLNYWCIMTMFRANS
jgi:hypothetical protein